MCGGECNNLKYYMQLAESGEWFEVSGPVEIELSETDSEPLRLADFTGTVTFVILHHNNKRRYNGKRPLRWRTIRRWVLRHT